MYATTASSSTGVNSASAGSTVETVTTEVTPAAGTPIPPGITSARAGIARMVRTRPRAGPNTTVAAASPIATRGAVALAGGPRPAGRPIARAAAMIDTIHVAAP